MEMKDLLLPLIAALWGCANLVLAATVELNKLRDKIILGHDAGHPVTLEHQKHIMNNDWKPMAACAIIVCLGFSAVAAFSPLLLNEQTFKVSLIALGIASFSALMGLVWIPGALADWRAMNAAYEHRFAQARVENRTPNPL